MTSPMTLNRHKKSIITSYSLVTSKADKYNIRFASFDIKFTRFGFENAASLVMSTSVLKALPGILDIKRHSPSILYI